MEKSYLRLTAAATPETVRSEPYLQQALGFVLQKWAEMSQPQTPSHEYFRTKARLVVLREMRQRSKQALQNTLHHGAPASTPKSQLRGGEDEDEETPEEKRIQEELEREEIELAVANKTKQEEAYAYICDQLKAIRQV